MGNVTGGVVRSILPALAAAYLFTQQTRGEVAPATPPAPLRTWTTQEGRAFQASLVKAEGSRVTLRLASGQIALIALPRLSAGDQSFVAATLQAAATGASSAPTGSFRVPVEKRTWPVKVEVDSKAIEVTKVSESPAENKFVYRSRNFEFTSQDKLAESVMKEIVRTFEATHSLVQALPWGIDPKPPTDLGAYRAKFYLDRGKYVADGAPANSAGVYFTKDRIFRIPFESLGLEQRGKTWFKKTDYRGDTLVHEVTHQMMDEFLPFLPGWVIEGTAEYTEMLPYNAGVFLAGAHERGIKEYVKKSAGPNTPLSLGDVSDRLEMKTGSDSYRFYLSSCLLVYYFSHLDGDGKGTRFFRYLDEMAEARDAWEVFFKDPRVERLADGKYRYPTSLTPPSQMRTGQYGISRLDVLLDGRTAQQIQKDVVAAYQKLGIRW